MFIDKQVAWIRPFLDSVSDLVPLDKLEKIEAEKQKAGDGTLEYGYITQEAGKYVITITTHEHDHVLKSKQELMPGMVIDTLAHELAHMVHWEHTWHHMALQALVLKRFSSVVRKTGIQLWD